MNKLTMVITAGSAVAVGATSLYKACQFASKRVLGAAVVVGAIGAGAIASAQGTDATVITTAVSTGFVGVATLCVSVGTFFGVYKMVKKIK